MILINLETASYYSVRGSGAAILTLVDRGLGPAAIVSALRRGTRRMPRIEFAVTSFLESLLDEGLIGGRDAAAQATRPSATTSARRAVRRSRMEKYTDLRICCSSIRFTR
jgi:hypothetical protein